jgi:hypothetical protein
LLFTNVVRGFDPVLPRSPAFTSPLPHSPLPSLQIWWKELPEQPLPPDIVKKLDGKGIAIVGYEVDQIRITPEGDVSVPINMHYNHHRE